MTTGEERATDDRQIVAALTEMARLQITICFRENVMYHPGYTTSSSWGGKVGVTFLECMQKVIKDTSK